MLASMLGSDSLMSEEKHCAYESNFTDLVGAAVANAHSETP
jgi:hypothetical protein